MEQDDEKDKEKEKKNKKKDKMKESEDQQKTNKSAKQERKSNLIFSTTMNTRYSFYGVCLLFCRESLAGGVVPGLPTPCSPGDRVRDGDDESEEE